MVNAISESSVWAKMIAIAGENHLTILGMHRLDDDIGTVDAPGETRGDPSTALIECRCHQAHYLSRVAVEHDDIRLKLVASTARPKWHDTHHRGISAVGLPSPLRRLGFRCTSRHRQTLGIVGDFLLKAEHTTLASGHDRSSRVKARAHPYRRAMLIP